MQLIQCTKKLQKEMGLKKSDLAESKPTFSFLGSWHANLLYIDRRKCVLFVNDKTLLNFIVTDVKKANIKDLGKLFREFLSCVLSSEGISKLMKEKILLEYRELGYSGTSSKSVLGSMNDLAFHYKHHILSSGGVHNADVPDIIRKLNHMPIGAIEYKYAIDALNELYNNAT